MASNPPTQTQTQSPTQNILPQVPPPQAAPARQKVAPAQSGIPASVKADQLFDSGGKLKWAAILAPLIGTGIGALVKGRKGAEFGAALGTGLSKGITAGISARGEQNVKETQFAEQQRQGLLRERDEVERRISTAITQKDWAAAFQGVERMEFNGFITPEDAEEQRKGIVLKRSQEIVASVKEKILHGVQTGGLIDAKSFLSLEQQSQITNPQMSFLNDYARSAANDKEAGFFVQFTSADGDIEKLNALKAMTTKKENIDLIDNAILQAKNERETKKQHDDLQIRALQRTEEQVGYENATNRGLRIATLLAADNQWSYQQAALLSLGIDKSPDQIKVGSAEEAEMISRAAEMKKYTTEEKITDALLRWEATSGTLFPDSGMRATEREKFEDQLREILRLPSSNDPEGDTARNKFIGSQGWKSRIDQMIAQGKDFTPGDRAAMVSEINKMANSSQHKDMTAAVEQQLIELIDQYVNSKADFFISVRNQNEDNLQIQEDLSKIPPENQTFYDDVIKNINNLDALNALQPPPSSP